jgi:diguanylate cyclase (GGDEF)-like protein/PAS domain S-box-containing protein
MGATLRTFGFEKKDDILQLKAGELSPPKQPEGTDSATEWENIITNASKSGACSFEWLYCKKDGQVFPAEVTLSPITLRSQNVFQITIRDITERKKAEETLNRYHDFLENLSVTDGLTGIANRRRFDQCIDMEWRRAIRNKSPISLIMMDIDYFKTFNDSYGHLAGDDCLNKLARCLNESLRRPMDLAARYGGEEFACILPETNIEGALCVCKNIRQRVYDLNIQHSYSKVSDRISVSMGVASLIPDIKQSYLDLMKAADDCLYSAKENGRNQEKAYRI